MSATTQPFNEWFSISLPHSSLFSSPTPLQGNMSAHDISQFGPDDIPPMSHKNVPVADPDARRLPLPLDRSGAADQSPDLSVYVIPVTANTSTTQQRDLSQVVEAPLQVSHHAHLQLKLDYDKLRASEAEVRLDRDTLRRKLNEAEKRLALCEQMKSEEAEVEMRLLRVQMERKEHEHSAEMKEMLKKIAWYVEHQDFSKDQEELISQQQETIHSLRLRFMALESQVSSAGIVRTDKDKQIQILQRRNLELEELIKQRYPNSLPELIRACQPSARQTVQVRQLEGRVADLIEQLAEKDRSCEATLVRLRGEADQLRLHFQQRLVQLEEEMRGRLATTQTKKVAELEKQVVDTRKYYTERLKSQEMVIQSLRRGGGGGAKSGVKSAHHQDVSTSVVCKAAACQTRLVGPVRSKRAASSSSEGSSDSDSQRRRRRSNRHSKPDISRELALEREMHELRAMVAVLSRQPPQTEVLDPSTSTSNVGLLSAFQRQVVGLQQELAVHKRLLSEAQEAVRNTVQECDTRIAQARREWGDEIVRMNENHGETLIKMRRSHEDEMRALTTRLAEAKDAASKSFTRSVIEGVRGGAKGGSRGSKEGFSEYVQLVTDRLQILEERQIVKEKEFATQIEEIRRLADYELAVEKQKRDLLIDQKNNEIKRFRVEMDELLLDMSRLGNVAQIH